MALRDQPYMPLYVQDFLVDEKLCECSAESTGVYIRLMCIMHKSDEYGTILLKQKDKQSDKQVLNFADKLAKHMPYQVEVIKRSLSELLENGVIQVDGDRIIQKRMIKDNHVSLVRASAGKKGGDKTAFAKAKDQASSENENEIEYVNEYKDLFDLYMSLDLIKHKELTKEMKSAIDVARRRCGYSFEDMKKLLRRHALVVKLTANDGEYLTKKRGITEFFGQKVRDGTCLICSEYADDGAKTRRHIEILNKRYGASAEEIPEE